MSAGPSAEPSWNVALSEPSGHLWGCLGAVRLNQASHQREDGVMAPAFAAQVPYVAVWACNVDIQTCSNTLVSLRLTEVITRCLCNNKLLLQVAWLQQNGSISRFFFAFCEISRFAGLELAIIYNPVISSPFFVFCLVLVLSIWKKKYWSTALQGNYKVLSELNQHLASGN